MNFLDSIKGFSFSESKLQESTSFNYAELDQAKDILDSKVAGDISNSAIRNSSIEAIQTALDLIPYDAIENSQADPKIKNVFAKFIESDKLDHIIAYYKFEKEKLENLKNDVSSLISTKVNVRPYLKTCDTIVARLMKLREILAETINSEEMRGINIIAKKAKILQSLGAIISDGTDKFKIIEVSNDLIKLSVDDGSEREVSPEDFNKMLKAGGSSEASSILNEDDEDKINEVISKNGEIALNYQIWLASLNEDALQEIDSEPNDDARLDKIEAAIEAIKNLAAAMVEIANRDKKTTMEEALTQREAEASPRATGSRVKNAIFKNLKNSLAKSLLPAINSGQITAPGGYFALFRTLLEDNEERMLRVINERIYRGDTNKADEFLRVHTVQESAEEAHQLDYLNASEQWILDWIDSDQDGTFPEKKALSCSKTIESIAEVKRKEIKNFYLSKGFNISNFAAFRIKPEIRLPLYQKVKLAVTKAERIAETPLGKIGKGLSYLYDATYTDGTVAGNHAQNQAVFRAANKFFSGIVTLLGGKQKGRDYEKMMHKFTNSVLPLRAIGFTSEDPAKEVKKEIKEDMVAPLPSSGAIQVNPESPGTPFQVPQSLPDKTMDTFAQLGPQKKKKGKSKVSSAKIMNFKQFMKHVSGE